MENKSNYNKKLGIALLSATILSGLALGTQSVVYADDTNATSPVTSTTTPSEVAEDNVVMPSENEKTSNDEIAEKNENADNPQTDTTIQIALVGSDLNQSIQVRGKIGWRAEGIHGEMTVSDSNGNVMNTRKLSNFFAPDKNLEFNYGEKFKVSGYPDGIYSVHAKASDKKGVQLSGTTNFEVKNGRFQIIPSNADVAKITNIPLKVGYPSFNYNEIERHVQVTGTLKSNPSNLRGIMEITDSQGNFMRDDYMVLEKNGLGVHFGKKGQTNFSVQDYPDGVYYIRVTGQTENFSKNQLFEGRTTFEVKDGKLVLNPKVSGGVVSNNSVEVNSKKEDTIPTKPTIDEISPSEVAEIDITTPISEADYEAIQEAVWGSWYFKDEPTVLTVPTIDTEPFRALDTDHANKIEKWSLPKLVDAYNTNRAETYNDTDILEIWKEKYNYKEVDGRFADFNTSTIEDGNTYYFKEDKLFVTKYLGGRDGKAIAFSPKEQWVVNKDHIRVPFYLPAGPGDIDPSYPLVATVKLNNKDYTGGISKSKFYLSNVVDTRKAGSSTTTKPVDKKDTPTKAEKTETSTKILLNELSGYTYEQVLAAQVWYTLTDGNYPYLVFRQDANTAITGTEGAGKNFPDVTYHLYENTYRSYAIKYTISYKDNGDGTVTVYNVPKHWHIDDSEIASFTQNILDTAKIVKLKEASKADILKILKMGDFTELTTGNSSNSDVSTSTDADDTGNTTSKQTDTSEKPTPDKTVDKKDILAKTEKAETSTKILLNGLSGYTYEQVLAAQVWCTLTDGAYSYSLTRHEAGEAISKYGPSKQFPSVTYYLRENSDRSYAAAYVVTYKDNGDGTVTVYNVPKHWQMPSDEILSVTQNILDTAKVVKLKEVSKADILKVLKMGDFPTLTTGNSSNSGASTSTDADNTGNTKQDKPTANSNTEVIFPIVVLDDKTDTSTSSEAAKNLASQKGERQDSLVKNQTLSRVESRHLPKTNDGHNVLSALGLAILMTLGLYRPNKREL